MGALVPYKALMQWLLMFGLILFGLFLSWDLGVLQVIIAQDNTRLCLVIIAMLLVMSMHCAYRSFFLTQQYLMLEHCYQRGYELMSYPAGLSLAQDYFSTSCTEADSDKTLQAEVLLEKARGTHQVGWFIAGTMIKLGLLGTVIGFIVMLSSVSGLDSLTISDIKTLMQRMTQGMGIAMSTTLVGLTCSMVLSLQYLFLDRIADQFVTRTIEADQHLSSADGVTHGATTACAS